MMSGSIQTAMSELTPSLERADVFQLFENMKHKLPRELYDKSWRNLMRHFEFISDDMFLTCVIVHSPARCHSVAHNHDKTSGEMK